MLSFKSGTKTLYVKGAESAILDRVKEGDIETTQKMVDEYATVRAQSVINVSLCLF